MKKLSMTMTAFTSTLYLLNCVGTCLLPTPSQTADQGAEAFLRGRDMLCQNGWASLDFDGKITPSREFARMVYGIAHAEGCMRLELPGKTQWYLRAPTEMLFIEIENETVFLERRSGRTLMPWLRECVLQVPEGTLTTLQKERTRNASLEQFPQGSELRAKELVKHLALLFEKEGENA